MSTLASEIPEATIPTATLRARLDELSAEHANGCRQLARLDGQREELAATIERIDGAITALRELLGPPRPTAVPAPH